MSRLRDLQAFCAGFPDPVRWGIDDCSSVLAQWVRRRGVDVTLPAYGSKEEAHALIARHGSLEATWRAVIDGRLMETGEAEAGSVAVIDTRLFGQVGVICLDRHHVAWRREEGGFHVIAARRHVAIWSVP